jgi:hypothetical protein
MGDRAVAGVKATSTSPIIFMYSHHGGSDQDSIFADALAKAERRWSDDSYATRIIMSQLVGNEWNEETGFGMYVGGTAHGSDYHYILIADLETQQVLICDNDNSDDVVAQIPFADFISNHADLIPEATRELNKRKHEEFISKYPELASVFTS